MPRTRNVTTEEKGKGVASSSQPSKRKKKTVHGPPRDPTPSSSEEEEFEGSDDEGKEADYDPSLFLTDKSLRIHKKLISKNISTGSIVRFEEIQEFNLKKLFEYQKWVNFLTLDVPTYANVVRLFYANLVSNQQDANTLRTKVHGMTFTITPESLAKILGVPKEGCDIFQQNLENFDSYPQNASRETSSIILHGNNFSHLYNDPYSKTLTNRAKVLANLLSHTVIPKTGSRDRLSGCHKLLTYCIFAKIKVSLPLLLLRYMLNLSDGRTNLYYGKVITLIVNKHGVDLSNETEIVKPDKAFGILNINLMTRRGALPTKPTSHAIEPQSPQPQVPKPYNFQDFENRVFQRLDAMQHENRNMYNQLIDRFEYHMGYLYSQAHYPPPPPFGQASMDTDPQDGKSKFSFVKQETK